MGYLRDSTRADMKLQDIVVGCMRVQITEIERSMEWKISRCPLGNAAWGINGKFYLENV